MDKISDCLWIEKVRETRTRLLGSADTLLCKDDILKDKKNTRERLVELLIDIVNCGKSLAKSSEDYKRKCDEYLTTIKSFNSSLDGMTDMMNKKFENQMVVIDQMTKEVSRNVDSCSSILKTTTKKFQDHVTELKKIEDKPKIMDWSKINFVEPIKNVVKKTIRTDRETSEKCKNIMIYGMKKDPTNEAYDSIEKYVDNIRSELDLDRTDIISWCPVGSTTDDTRPVRVVLKDKSLVKDVVKGSCAFRKFGKYFENVYITPDRTSEQLKMRKKLVDQLKTKIKEDPKTRWVIKNGQIVNGGVFKTLLRV